jgi:hypothetical protein
MHMGKAIMGFGAVLVLVVTVAAAISVATTGSQIAQDERRLRRRVDVLIHEHRVLERYVVLTLRPWVIQQARRTAEALPPSVAPPVEPLPAPPIPTPVPTPSPLPSIEPSVIPTVTPSPSCIPMIEICPGEGVSP